MAVVNKQNRPFMRGNSLFWLYTTLLSVTTVTAVFICRDITICSSIYHVHTLPQVSPHLVCLLGDNPIGTQWQPIRVDVPYRRQDLRVYAALMATPRDNDSDGSARSRLLHAAKLPGELFSAPKQWLQRDEQARIARVFLPARTFQSSWRGLEVSETDEGKVSEHRDQLLSTLAECGVPLNAALETPEGEYVLRDLLRTSLNEFHLGQPELPWTAIAYASYLPPQSTWTNRIGETFSFDQLADVIIQRPFNKESCGGVHSLMAVTRILQADRDLHFLQPETRLQLDDHIKALVLDAVASQLSDGSWPMQWSSTRFFQNAGHVTPMPTIVGKLGIAGHLLEWFNMLPSELQPPDSTVRLGALWAWSQLISIDDATLVKEFCPLAHVILALDLAAGR